MRKVVLIIAMAFIVFAATSQVKVIDKKPINETAKIKIDMSFMEITQMQRAFYVRMKKEEILYDVPFHKGKIDTLFSNMWTVHEMFEHSLSVADTVELTVIDGKYYQDVSKMDLVAEKQYLIDKYNGMVDRYGELAIYESEFQKMKKRYEQINNWQKQIIGN